MLPPWCAETFAEVLHLILNRLQRLLAGGVLPVVVFDGAALLRKAAEHQRRRERKLAALGAVQSAKDEAGMLAAQVHVTWERRR